jgi:hypothetical protein
LTGEGRLCHMQPPSGASVMFFFCNRHEVSQMSKFHFDTLWASVQS